MKHLRSYHKKMVKAFELMAHWLIISGFFALFGNLIFHGTNHNRILHGHGSYLDSIIGTIIFWFITIMSLPLAFWLSYWTVFVVLCGIPWLLKLMYLDIINTAEKIRDIE